MKTVLLRLTHPSHRTLIIILWAIPTAVMIAALVFQVLTLRLMDQSPGCRAAAAAGDPCPTLTRPFP